MSNTLTRVLVRDHLRETEAVTLSVQEVAATTPFEIQTRSASRRAARMRVLHILSGTHWLAGGVIANPIEVVIDASNDGTVIASEPQTGIFGSGAELSSALLDLREALVEHREILEDSAPLAPDLQRQLQVLRTHLLPRV